MKKYVLASTSVAALLAFVSPPVHASPVVAQIYGIYDAEAGIGDLPGSVTGNANNPNQVGSTGAYDTPSLFFVNPSGYQITGAQMVLTVNTTVNNGWNTYNNLATQTVGLGTLNANTITQVTWGSGGTLFTGDYDDEYGSNYGFNPFPGSTKGTQNPGSALADCTLTYGAGAPDPQWQNFCAPTGNFEVAFTGTLSGTGADNGDAVSALFAENDVGGHYTGWEGLDANGWSENINADVHSGTVSGVLADICIGGVGVNCSSPLQNVPEPGTMSLLGAGLGALALTRRRRRKS